MAIPVQIYSDNFGFHLGGSQGWMENAFGLNEICCSPPEKQPSLQQKTQNMCFENSGLLSENNDHQEAVFSRSIATQIETQRQEIDRFISSQNDRLRVVLEEQRRQIMALLLRRYEAEAASLLTHKDEQIAKAMARKLELEELLRRTELENQRWQRWARESEGMVMSMKCSIKRLRESACLANGAEDAESCCDMVDGGERRGDDERESEERRARKMACKNCGSRGSCVMFLPCRHLCSCEACQGLLSSCPVCGVVKKASIEVLV